MSNVYRLEVADAAKLAVKMQQALEPALSKYDLMAIEYGCAYIIGLKLSLVESLFPDQLEQVRDGIDLARRSGLAAGRSEAAKEVIAERTGELT